MHYDVGDLVRPAFQPQRLGVVVKKNAANKTDKMSEHAVKISLGCSYVYYVYFSDEGAERGPYYQSELSLEQHGFTAFG